MVVCENDRQDGEATEREPLELGRPHDEGLRPGVRFSFQTVRFGAQQPNPAQETTGMFHWVANPGTTVRPGICTGSRVVGEAEGARSGSCASDSWDLLYVSVKLELIIFSYMPTV